MYKKVDVLTYAYFAAEVHMPNHCVLISLLLTLATIASAEIPVFQRCAIWCLAFG